MAPTGTGSKRKLEKVLKEPQTNGLTDRNGDYKREEFDIHQPISDNDSSDSEYEDEEDSDAGVLEPNSDGEYGESDNDEESDGSFEGDDENDEDGDEKDTDDSEVDGEEETGDDDSSEVDGEEEEDDDDESVTEGESDDDQSDDSELVWESDENDSTSEPLTNSKSSSGISEEKQTPTATPAGISNVNEKQRSNSKVITTGAQKVSSALNVKSDAAEEISVQGASKNVSKAENKLLDPSNEYESGDTSDEEDIRNTVGNVPMNWYDEYPHIGYDWDANPILKPQRGDALDEFLNRMEDPNYFRTVKDPQTGQDVVLSEEDVRLIKRLRRGQIPDANFDDEAPWIDYFTSDVMKTPIVNVAPSKKSFLPNAHEAAIVSKYVALLKEGKIRPRWKRALEEARKRRRKPYMIWGMDDTTVEPMRRIHDHLPAPRKVLPGHAESYNPPAEYLLTAKQKERWSKDFRNPRKNVELAFVPRKYQSLREVPAYGRFLKERFLRCMDLYMCPRGIKMKYLIEAEDLIPKLPNPKDLQPFPTTLSMVYRGHTDMVRTITVDAKGQFMISGSDDLTIKVWEVSTGRCMRTIHVGGIVRSVCWCPNQALSLVAVAADRKLLLINPGVGDNLVVAKTDSLLKQLPEETSTIIPPRVLAAVQWAEPTSEEWATGIRAVINHFKEIKQVTWHGRGDYFATVMPEGLNRSVLIHQLSKRRSQMPFSKSRGLVQCVQFHPIRPMLFVATQRMIRVYDLSKQAMVKKLNPRAKWISSMAVHPGGDNLIIGTYDKKIAWFDLDLSTEPYKSIKFHQTAVRGVAFHKRYPLFATAADDKSVIISHGMVYNDLNKNALIVPLKRLQIHDSGADEVFGVFDVEFHPTQPWVFSSGGDNTIRLCT